MSTRHELNFSYPSISNELDIEQMQEHAIRQLHAVCPYIVENELVIEYSRPIPRGSVIDQQMFVECVYCRDGVDVY